MSTLSEILDSRENRAQFQKELIQKYQRPLVCFTMNIPGDRKTSPLIEKAFRIGLERLLFSLKASRMSVSQCQTRYLETGPEAYVTVEADPLRIKTVACEIETMDDLGRLMDMDVIDPVAGNKIERKAIGLESRRCLVCDNDARVCAVLRAHPLEQLIDRTNTILDTSIRDFYADKASGCAVRALMYEVSCTPKPGLVDMENNGSHKDMDFMTFCSSASVLSTYFRQCYICGFTIGNTDELFSKLQTLGKQAEGEMFKVTRDVNTHKGAIFTLGIILASYAMTKARQESFSQMYEHCKSIGKHALGQLKCENGKPTAGQRIYEEHGLSGVRGEMADGLPAVRKEGLKTLDHLIKCGWDDNFAGCMALISIISVLDDTNIISRGGFDAGLYVQKCATAIINSAGDLGTPDTNKRDHVLSLIRRLDRDLTERNISPGGSADMLAACWLIRFLKELEC